jgi:hypothetical protein
MGEKSPHLVTLTCCGLTEAHTDLAKCLMDMAHLVKLAVLVNYNFEASFLELNINCSIKVATLIVK